MRYLLDKVTARLIMRGLLKQSKNEELTEQEIFALDFFRRTALPRVRLFIVPATSNTLQRPDQSSEYSAAIRRFLSRVEVAKPTRYFKRWARRLRNNYEFTREDAAVLALATFSTDQKHSFISMQLVVTQDQPMINNWSARQAKIQKHFETMRENLVPPYNQAFLPKVVRPEEARIEKS